MSIQSGNKCSRCFEFAAGEAGENFFISFGRSRLGFLLLVLLVVLVKPSAVGISDTGKLLILG